MLPKTDALLTQPLVWAIDTILIKQRVTLNFGLFMKLLEQ